MDQERFGGGACAYKPKRSTRPPRPRAWLTRKPPICRARDARQAIGRRGTSRLWREGPEARLLRAKGLGDAENFAISSFMRKCPDARGGYHVVMDIVLGYRSALEFWRFWSGNHPVSLDAFHGRHDRMNSYVPFRILPTSGAMRDTAYDARTARYVCDEIRGSCSAGGKASRGRVPLDERDVEKALDLVQVPTSLDAPHFADSSCGMDAGVLHLVGRRRPGLRKRPGIAYHHCSVEFPTPFLARVAPRLFVSLPELVFCHLAATLSYGELLALGFELCGCYPLTENRGALVRRPLCSPSRLLGFAKQLKGACGVKLARVVAQHVRAKSASVMETEVAALVSAPRLRGGFGVKDVKLNERIELGGAKKLARRDHVTVDLLLADGRLAIECDGATFHADRYVHVLDARKRNALAARGIQLRSVTWSQFANVHEFQEIIRQPLREAGHPLRRLNARELDRHMELRHQLRRFHRDFSDESNASALLQATPTKKTIAEEGGGFTLPAEGDREEVG